MFFSFIGEELDDADRELIENLKLDFQSAPGKPTRKTWQERQADNREAWDNIRADVFKSYVSRQPFYSNSDCGRCRKVLESAAIRCMTCKQHYCWHCDDILHCRQPFHHRFHVTRGILQSLNPTEFYDQDWKLIIKGNLYNLYYFFTENFLINYFLIYRCVCPLLCAK